MIAVKINLENIIVDTRVVDSLDNLDSSWVSAPSKLHGIGHNINDTITNPNQYVEDRQQAYASIEEQLDMQYWDAVNGTSTWKEHIDAVKAAHPKPTE
jgi:hypothetical protein